MSHSSEFAELLRDENVLADLIAGSAGSLMDFARWDHNRRFISSAIHRDGSILDIGCANGFLLKCLQQWCDHQLIPYGIDVNANKITDATILFAEYAQNFATLSVDCLGDITKHGLPAQFDFVYCSISFDPTIYKKTLDLVAPGGRLIFGFYGKNAHPIGSAAQLAELNEVRSRITYLAKQGCKFSQVRDNPYGSSHIVAWLDR
jgi:SAM-dependent methyltransferase